MYRRVLELCRCPRCGGGLRLAGETLDGAGEIEAGLVHCAEEHWFPVVRGVPRLLPEALAEHWPTLQASVERRDPSLDRRIDAVVRGTGGAAEATIGDPRTREHFDRQWEQHEVGARTWGLDLAERVRTQFVEPVRLPAEELAGKVVLDAGCGDGSQSVAYTELGVEVIAIDLSTGVDKGHAYRALHPGARPDHVHFVQADLQQPPLATGSVDIVLSEGTLYHTPDTQATFRRLATLVRPGGRFYVTLFKYERFMTPLVNGVRAATTRVPTAAFTWAATHLTGPYSGLRRAATTLGIRSYPPLTRSEAAVALMDLLGPPRAHYHTVAEVIEWYRTAGFDDVWVTNDGRRSFGVCGRRSGADDEPGSRPAGAAAAAGAVQRGGS